MEVAVSLIGSLSDTYCKGQFRFLAVGVLKSLLRFCILKSFIM